MKKLLALVALMTVVISANAASFKWTVAASSFGSTKVGADAMGYLVYLGSKDLSDYSFSDVLALDTVAETASKVSKITNNGVNADDNKTVGNWAFYLTYTDNNLTYYNISSEVLSISQSAFNALQSEGTALDPVAFAAPTSTVNAPVSSWDAASIGKGWYAKTVPEPATGALALAGIALLFRRRKA